jgi:ferredoxin
LENWSPSWPAIDLPAVVRRVAVTESIHFHTDLYRRDALEFAAEKYHGQIRVEFADAGAHVVAHLQSLTPESAVLDEFCNEVFSETARRLRGPSSGAPRAAAPRGLATNDPPWGLLRPFTEGTHLALGWVLESIAPIRDGAAHVALRHDDHGVARVAIRRNSGAPLGVAHTDHLDFMLMNGGSGARQTDESIGRILIALARALGDAQEDGPDADLLDALAPHAEARSPQVAAAGARPAASRRVAPEIDLGQQSVAFDFDEAGIGRLALYDAVLAFADRCFVFLERGEGTDIRVLVKARRQLSADEFKVLVRDVTKALNHVARQAVAGAPARPEGGLPPLVRSRVDIEAVLRELEAADPMTVGVGFQPERGPGHENLRVMNILGTGACDSDCLFCCEKFNPGNRLMPTTDATRQAILEADGEFDMLFFASGEPTIHPKLFEHVALARSQGFRCFGMSSHFRTFADPRFALKTLQAGFEYFDISLHAADVEGQLAVNPIGDGGASLAEALQGLANIFRLAEALSIRVSVTQKIVVSRLNVTQLDQLFHATYDRGVRHFIVQPVRTLGLAPERQQALAISEDEILPYLNELLAATEGLGASIKPYGFSRQHLIQGAHIEHEQNRIKNVMGKAKVPRQRLDLPARSDPRPTDGRHYVEVRTPEGDHFAFAADGSVPILDVALQRGAHLPFGCRMGSCGMCTARVVEGEVDQSSGIFLDEEQQSAGFVLLCQAKPLSDVTVVMCTDDEIDPL